MLSQAKKNADRRDAFQLRTNGGSQHHNVELTLRPARSRLAT